MPEREEADAPYAEIAALVARRSGMVFAPNRRVEAGAGIARAMKEAGASDISAYVRVVRTAVKKRPS